MNMLDFEILGSSSAGNCIIFNKYMAIDMGITYKRIKPYLKGLKIILLTHIHSDHFKSSTIKKIAYEKPNIKWVCRYWLVYDLINLGVKKKNIYILEDKTTYDLGLFKVTPIETYHDVPNTSYKVDFNPTTMYYATDTYKLDYLDCLKGLDYYFVERNYSEEEINKRIEEKKINEEFVYEERVKNSHMSEEEINSFLITMMGNNSQFVYCHEHKEKVGEDDG